MKLRTYLYGAALIGFFLGMLWIITHLPNLH